MWDGFALLQPHYLDALLNGQLTFGTPLAWPWLLVAVVIMVGLAVFAYWRTTKPLSPIWRWGFISLRTASLLLLLFLLLEPGVIISEVEPQETYVAVLVDDSQSMSIADQLEQPSRHQHATDILYGRTQLVERLAQRFQVRTYRFGADAQRIAGPAELQQNASRSSLGGALAQVEAELGSFPLAGVVVISDGADNSDIDPLPVATRLADRAIPIYTLGIGAQTIQQDVRIESVHAARSLLEDAVYHVDVQLAQEGYNNQTVNLTLQHKGTVVAQQPVTLTANSQRVSLELSPEEKAILVYDVAIETQPGETIEPNNHHRIYVDNREQPPLRILYVEGQPRNEYKFLRRVASGDSSLQLASYLQTGPRKFLRQGISSPSQLQDGFPKTAEALFAYDALIFGNLERGFFSAEQLTLVQEFVATRGGGFLMLGGLHEGFIDTPVAEMLPVSLVRANRLPGYLQGGPRRGEHPTGRTFPPQLTRQGEYSPLLRLANNDTENRQRWRDMPALEGVYVTGRPKPGATVLIEHPELTYQNQPLPVLTTQRYGAGRSMVMATASSWRWQMLQPHDDETHEQLWRQWLRWLAGESRQRVSLQLDKSNHALGELVRVNATLWDAEYRPDNQGLLWLLITSPDGETREVSMDWQVDGDGQYAHSFIAEQKGIYDLQVRVSGEPDLAATTPVLVTQPRREFLNAAMDAGLLQRIAATGQGRFYRPADAGELVDDLNYNPNPYSQQRFHSLWDQPVFWWLLLLLVGSEWALRRYRGLS